MDANDAVTATRHTLADEWAALSKKVDWMSVYGLSNYVNKMVSGKDLHENGHWAIHCAQKHVIPLYEKKLQSGGDGSFRVLSLGSGSGHIEESLFVNFGWPCTELLGLEYDSALREAAAKKFAAYPAIQAQFEFFDFNSPECRIPRGHFDIVFCCHSIHHATDLEGLLPYLNSLLSPDGLFIGIDYFGPTRFQVEYQVQQIVNELYACLPQELKIDLTTNMLPPRIDPPTLDTIMKVDISEASRSADLRTMLFANFPVVEMKNMGGTVLRWLLQNRAGNFLADNDCHNSIAKLLIYIEKLLLETHIVRSDDLFFVVKQSTRL